MDNPARRAALLLLVAALALFTVAACSPPGNTIRTAEGEELTTWWFDANVVDTDGPVAEDVVRRSADYQVKVATVAEPTALYDSFVHMSIPRSGRDKEGYGDEDGAEFAAEAGFSMSWSTFLHTVDVWVEVSLTDSARAAGQTIRSAEEVTIRPRSLNLETQWVDEGTVRIRVPHRPEGHRFSVEFDTQLVTAYNSMAGDSGTLTTQPGAEAKAVHTEPRHALLVFAEPRPTGERRAELVPPSEGAEVLYPEPGRVEGLAETTAEIIHFRPGVYSMGPTLHARLPASVRWIHLDPGAYVKGAFQFLDDSQPHYKVTGFGVLSGENYVYEPDTNNGYKHLDAASNCHESCVKMLQFASSGAGQKLTLHGITVVEPPYHSFVVYGQEQAFAMDVEAYKQVGAWYWQTDGLELYGGSRMRNTFFHANDDVLKLYHSDVKVENTVVWKNENGPVIQWGWTGRTLDDVSVVDTHVIHNRMYWKDVKYNTCILNSASHWEDTVSTQTGDPFQTVRGLRFENITVEGMTNCAIRLYALSNTEDIEVTNLAIDAWNELGPASQVSTLQAFTDPSGTPVTIGDEVGRGQGLALRNYSVGGEVILRDAGNAGADQLGRLGFDPALARSWQTYP